MKSIPLYKQIQNRIKEQIQTRVLRPGDRVPSEKELAEQFRVSQITAKNALIGLADEGIVERIQGKGTFVSQKPNHLFRPDKGFIGVVLPTMKTQIDQQILNGLEYYLYKEGFQILIRITRESSLEETSSIQTYQDMSVKGMIIFPTESQNYNDLILHLALNQFPLVLIDRYFKKINTYSVISDNIQGAYDTICYFLQKGHRKIALVSPSITNSVTEDRAAGFEQAFQDYNLPIDKNLWCLPDLGLIEAGGAEKYIHQFFERKPEVTAVFTVNAEMTTYTISALNKQNRRIPDEVEVISFDRPQHPGIPYVLQDVNKLCQSAVELIIEQIKGEREMKICVFPVELCFPEPCKQ